MTFLASKKPPFKKTTLSNEKTKVFLQKSRYERYLKMRNFFDYIKMTDCSTD